MTRISDRDSAENLTLDQILKNRFPWREIQLWENQIFNLFLAPWSTLVEFWI